MPDADIRSYFHKEWRTDLFKFRAFKFAVIKLLDALEVPTAPEFPITEEHREKAAAALGGTPEFTKLFLETHKSPEDFGDFTFKNLWTQVVMSKYPFTEQERKMIRKHPFLGQVMEREYYGFQRARQALELKPEELRAQEALELLSKIKAKDERPTDASEPELVKFPKRKKGKAK